MKTFRTIALAGLALTSVAASQLVVATSASAYFCQWQTIYGPFGPYTIWQCF